MPPTPPALAQATQYWSSERNDSVLCVADQCTSANQPSEDGHYAELRVEAIALLADDGTGHVTINNVSYPVLPLTLYYSATHEDNLVTTNTTAPDASYSGGVVFANGFVLGASAPGALPLQLWFRAYAGASQDYLTVASPAGVAWAQAHGYTLIDAGGASGGGWVLPAA